MTTTFSQVKISMNRFRLWVLCFLLATFAIPNYAQQGGKKRVAAGKTIQTKDYYALTIKAIKTKNQADFNANIKHIKNIDSLIVVDEDHAYSLLGFACLYNNKTAVQQLIARKADIACAFSDNMLIYDALYMAIINSDIQLATLFLSLGANPNQPYNEHGLCPLALSCSLNNIQMASLLLEKGAKADGLGNLGGEYVWYPLISAVENNNVNMVRLLLKYGAKRNVKDTEGFTPISIARSNRATEIIKLLEKR